jgi:hypothetical protein
MLRQVSEKKGRVPQGPGLKWVQGSALLGQGAAAGVRLSAAALAAVTV